MAVSDNLGRYIVSEAQTGKTIALNTAIGQLEDAITGILNISGDATAVPFTVGSDLAAREAGRAGLWVVNTDATDGYFNLTAPAALQHKVVFHNASSTPGVLGTAVFLPGEKAVIMADNGTVTKLVTNACRQDVVARKDGVPTGGEVLLRRFIGSEMHFYGLLAGSVCVAEVAATALTELFIKVDGVTIMTAQFAIGATTATFTDAVTTPKKAAAGSVLTVENQGSADATLAGIDIAIAGYVLNC